MNNQYLAPIVVFPHCIVLLLGSFAAWSGGRLCLRRPERRSYDLLHEGDFSSWLIRLDIDDLLYEDVINFLFDVNTEPGGFSMISNYFLPENGLHLCLRWSRHKVYILNIFLRFWSHIKGVSRRLACRWFQLWSLRGIEHKIQGFSFFLYINAEHYFT